jgi:hypothetical protein
MSPRLSLLEFWTRPWFWALMLLLVSLPFWVSNIPPLMDLPGHMARYHIMRELPGSPELQRYYDFDWHIMGNLGVDLIVYGVKDILDVERATWAVTLLTALLTAIAIPVLSRTVHGSIQPTSVMALPFVYAHFFHWGFLNYALSVALALLALAAWIKTSEHHSLWRSLLFAVASCVIWLCHSMGWGLFAVSAGMFELHRAGKGHGLRSLKIITETALRVWPAAVPLVLMLIWRSSPVTAGTVWEENAVSFKLRGIITVLRDQNMALDVGTVLVLVFALFWMLREKYATAAASLLWPAIGVGLTYVAMPAVVMTSAFADKRIAHVFFMLLILSIRWEKQTALHKQVMAGVCTLLFCIRMGITTFAWHDADTHTDKNLQALSSIPSGSPVLVYMYNFCGGRDWKINYEYNHLTDMAVVRRNSFVNSQWAVPGAQLLRIKYNQDNKYNSDPSQYVASDECPETYLPHIASELRTFPRNRFDYVWITNTGGRKLDLPADLELVQHDQNSMLLRIIKARPVFSASD